MAIDLTVCDRTSMGITNTTIISADFNNGQYCINNTRLAVYIYKQFYSQIKNALTSIDQSADTRMYGSSSDAPLIYTSTSQCNFNLASEDDIKCNGNTTTKSITGDVLDNIKGTKITYAYVHKQIMALVKKFTMVRIVRQANFYLDSTQSQSKEFGICGGSIDVSVKTLPTALSMIKEAISKLTISGYSNVTALLFSSFPSKTQSGQLVSKFNLVKTTTWDGKAGKKGKPSNTVGDTNGKHVNNDGATFSDGTYKYVNGCDCNKHHVKYTSDVGVVENTGTTTIQLPSTSTITSGQIITWNTITSFIDALAQKFGEQLKTDSRIITVKKYTCYSACHANWCSSRGRR